MIQINVGSRKSDLAIKQTKIVLDKLEGFYSNNPDRLKQLLVKHEKSKEPDDDGCEKLYFVINSMKTTGDKVLDKPLPEIGTQSVFTRELEIQLLLGTVDFVVHSTKDLPSKLPENCVLGAIIERDSPEDVIVLKKSLRDKIKPLDLLLNNHESESKHKIGTSSPRRVAMIRKCNKNLECIDIRGNLNTRISKLDNDEGEYSAIILAKAGLDRLGWFDRASSILSPTIDSRLQDWNYAVGQGAIGIECRQDDQFILELLQPIIHFQTTFEIIAERSIMRKLRAGCSVPLGVRSIWQKPGEILSLECVVLSKDGSKTVKASDNLNLLEDRIEINSDNAYVEETTNIMLSKTARQSDVENMLKCSNLGNRIAAKLIDLGCLAIMEDRKIEI